MNLSPKQYPNLNKYFNKTPKGFILFFLIMYALSAVGTFLALFGALFTSLTGILAKIGIKDVNSNFATFFRTAVVIVFSIILCYFI